jgi:DNA-binding MarR family transcriptional regulator
MTTCDHDSYEVMDVWSCIDRTGFAVSRLRELELGWGGLTIEQASVLYILSNSRDGIVTPGDLENVTMRQHHSVSVLTSGMEKAGLLKKVKYADSKRLKIVLTPEGCRHYRQIKIASLEETFSVLKEANQKELSGYLTSLLIKSRQLLGMPASTPVKILDENIQLKYNREIHELWTLLNRTCFAISRLRGLELARFGLTIEQASILHILSSREYLTAKELEDLTMRRQHSISSLLKGMIKMDWVTRLKTDEEKRYRIVITAAGKELFGRLTVDSLSNVLSVLSAEQKQKMVDVLEILLERARYLLGITYQPPFLKRMSGIDIQNID